MTALALLVPLFWAAAAGPAPVDRPRAFLDCHVDECFLDFLRTDIALVDYVRDRADADVHVMIAAQPTGAGGQEHTVTLIGLGRFQGTDETARYVSEKGEPEERVRRGLSRVLKLGLLRYVLKTDMAAYVDVSSQAPPAARIVHDPWKSWVLSVRGEGEIEGEESSRQYWVSLSAAANRVTPEWKINVTLSGRREEERFELDERDVVSTRLQRDLNGQAVKSLGPRWSIGAAGGLWRNTFENVGRGLRFGPAVEYSVFPYDQFTRRQMVALYRLELRDHTYAEETVFGKTSETVWREELELRLERRERWGSLEGELELSHYLHDLDKYRIELRTEAALRVVQGLTLNVFGEVSRVRDQLSLPRRGATPEEILLEQRQVASGYEYQAWAGITFSFGSIFNNVVNPRFGNDE